MSRGPRVREDCRRCRAPRWDRDSGLCRGSRVKLQVRLRPQGGPGPGGREMKEGPEAVAGQEGTAWGKPRLEKHTGMRAGFEPQEAMGGCLSWRGPDGGWRRKSDLCSKHTLWLQCEAKSGGVPGGRKEDWLGDEVTHLVTPEGDIRFIGERQSRNYAQVQHKAIFPNDSLQKYATASASSPHPTQIHTHTRTRMCGHTRTWGHTLIHTQMHTHGHKHKDA